MPNAKEKEQSRPNTTKEHLASVCHSSVFLGLESLEKGWSGGRLSIKRLREPRGVRYSRQVEVSEHHGGGQISGQTHLVDDAERNDALTASALFRLWCQLFGGNVWWDGFVGDR